MSGAPGEPTPPVAEVTGGVATPSQFSIADHYDLMEQLDRDVHDDIVLSRTEVLAALRLFTAVTPTSVFLPCFGTGRHIGALLDAGFKRVVGVDLSPKCVEKAQQQWGNDPRVELHVGDLTTWRTDEQFDLVLLLGNSFGDIVDPKVLAKVTEGMISSLKPLTGKFIMDYIGEGYLEVCEKRTIMEWEAQIDGRQVVDMRTPVFDPDSRVMTIHVRAVDVQTGGTVATTYYQKQVLSHAEVVAHFRVKDVSMVPFGLATEFNADYHAGNSSNLGMIARSTWWLGVKLR